MDKKVVLISTGGFLAISIRESLKKKDIEVIEIEPSILALEAKRDAANIFIVLLGDYTSGICKGCKFRDGRHKPACERKARLDPA